MIDSIGKAATLGYAMAETPSTLAELRKHVPDAVKFYWQTRSKQLQKQRATGGSDQGLRSAVTGGAQMDGFIKLLTQLVIEAGIDRAHTRNVTNYFVAVWFWSVITMPPHS